MKIKMLITLGETHGYGNYTTGNTYDVDADLGREFIENKWAENAKAEAAPVRVVATPRRKEKQ